MYSLVVALEEDQNVTIHTKLIDYSLVNSFRRNSRSGVEEFQLDNLSRLVSTITLSSAVDRYVWSLENSGEFSVKSIRQVIDANCLSCYLWLRDGLNLCLLKFGDSCCYVHDANDRLGTTNNGSNQDRGTSDNTINELLQKLLQQLEGMNVHTTSHSTNTTSIPNVAFYTGSPNHPSPSVGPTYPPNFPAQTNSNYITGHYPSLPPHALFAHPNPNPTGFVSPQVHTFVQPNGTHSQPTPQLVNLGASSHFNSLVTSVNTVFNTCMYPSISVSDSHSIPVTNTGHSILQTPTKSLHLNNVLITPHIVKNLIYVRQFVRDSNCTIEFDVFGFSVKDFLTRRVLLRCDSTRDLYPAPSPIPHAFLVSQHTWHQHLGHPAGEVMRHLVSSNFISYNKEKPPILCHAYHLGKHVRLPFVSSSTVISSCFDIIHSDVWTSPIPSLPGFKYLFLDHYSQFVWVYPLVNKSDVMSKFVLFRNYVRTQFKCEIKSFRCDHGGEFDNRRLHTLFAQNGIQFRFPCPQTSQQNGKSERIQNVMRDEYTALIKNSTWTLVPWPPDANVVRCIWLFRHKYLANGTLSRYKARLVANGVTQLEGVDVDETFSPIVKPGTIRTQIICSLHQEFVMTDFGSLNYFLGISVTRDSSGMSLSQKKYTVGILERAGMFNCNTSRTPVDTESKLGDTGDVVSDLTLYRSLAGSLQYLTFTRPNISYVVQQVYLHMHDPREPHLSALKRILHYVYGTLDYGLQLFSSSTKYLVAYLDADWAGYPTTRCSTFGYCVFLGNNLFSWSSKHQAMLSHSIAEAEYRVVANAVDETCWLRNLLR
ncbi:ribonuclease H-like domain-containing protein [Tanacetum coccineum]